MKKHFLFALSLGIATQVNAADLQDCAGIAADLDRLACYDIAAGKTPTTEVIETKGPWVLEVKKSDFEDTTDVYLSVQTDEPLTCGMFEKSRATLLLRCMENKTSAMLITSCHVASGFQGYGDVDYRVDKNPSKSRGFQESTDNRALGLWDGGKAIPFIKELFGGREILMRFTPFNESKTTARFNISGLEERIEPLRKACKW